MSRNPWRLSSFPALENSLFGFLGWQGPTLVQVQEDEFRVNLADIERTIDASERIDLRDLLPKMPKLPRYPRLAPPIRFLICLVGIAEFFPEPSPGAGEHA
jgi:hypothetical protein